MDPMRCSMHKLWQGFLSPQSLSSFTVASQSKVYNTLNSLFGIVRSSKEDSYMPFNSVLILSQSHARNPLYQTGHSCFYSRENIKLNLDNWKLLFNQRVFSFLNHKHIAFV